MGERGADGSWAGALSKPGTASQSLRDLPVWQEYLKSNSNTKSQAETDTDSPGDDETRAAERAQVEFYSRLLDQFLHCAHLETAEQESVQEARREALQQHIT